MTSRSPNVAVVGGGIIGSWTALHLVEAGVTTTLIEQFPLPHTRGSSHGMSRAFRFLGDEELGRLHYSLDRWRSLEASSGLPLYIKTGLLNFGPSGDPYLEKYMAVLRTDGQPCEWLEHHDITSRFPMLRYPIEWGAAWDPNGGILLAHRCLNAVQRRFLELGGRIMTADVESINFDLGDNVELSARSTTSGSSEALNFDKCIVCAGPWSSKLVPQLSGQLRSVLTPVSYWRDPTNVCSVENGFPILFNARLTGVYGLPSCEYRGLVKLLFHGGPDSDPDSRDLATCEPHLEVVQQYVQKHLPQLDHTRPAILESCMYTMTPDGQPIVDRLGERLIVGCGFSGSGFKHSPATGRSLAALALDQESRLPDGFLTDTIRLDRFSIN